MPLLKPTRGLQLNRNHPLARGLIGCWVMNEGAGGKIYDLAKAFPIADGALQGNTKWEAGKHGTALHFDGTGDYVDMPSSDFGSPDKLSIVAGAITDNPAFNDSIARLGDYCYPFWLYLSASSYQVTVGFRIGGGVNYVYGQKTLNAGDFHQHTATYDGSTIRLYIDDQEDNNGSASGSPDWDSGKSFSLGSNDDGSGQYWDGKIEYFYLYNRAITAFEVALLYREPFYMFEQLLSPELICPTIAAVPLAGSVSAQSEVSVTLKLLRKIAGTVTSNSDVKALLKSIPSSLETKRDWLKEALFNGMTANALKLGMTLSLGWFWFRVSGCSALYRGLGMEQIDFTNILTATNQNACVISPPSYVPHNSNSTYFYVIRRFNNCGYQEHTLTAAEKVSINASGEVEKPQPNKIFSSRAKQVGNNKVRLVWFYCPIEQKSQPVGFNVYYDARTGHIDYETPLATISYQGRKFYSYQSDALEAGRYLFAVKAEDSDGVENSALAQLKIQLNAANPDPIDILSAEDF